MASKLFRRMVRAAVLLGGVAVVAASSADAARPVRRTTRPAAARGFNLFAGAVNVLMNVNRVQCNVNNIGESCVDPTNSPVVGGGFWPKGSPNQYIFNSGLQVAAIIPGTDQPGFNWPGDTVGAFFFDPRGDQAHGEGRTNVFNGLSNADLAEWPSAAYVRDTTLFNAALIGRRTVSQQDLWTRFWDGNPTLSAGRQHSMGILVEQRALAWNFPAGNQDIVYFLYRFINITARDASRYANLANYGYTAADIAEIVAIANEWQDRAEAAYNVQIPDTGFAWTNMFAAFAQDPDVGQAGQNYSNAILPFNIAMAYKSDFREPTWQFPPDINGAPFAPAPGFEGVKYLASPGNIGIAMTGNTTNGAPFPDAVGVQRLWRNLSGNLLPTDGTCSVPDPQTRRFCYWAQVPADTRFYESSGPFTMGPGESAVIVVAYVHAAPVQSYPGMGSYSLTPFIGGNMVPGFAIEGRRLVTGQDTLRAVDRAAGWISHSDANGDGAITQNEVVTVPRSLLNKSLVAQAVFDARFLLPFAPEVPEFYLVAGDNEVTVAWARSVTDGISGDPFFAVASNPANALYDPNFREFDVEGYRIWRGRTQAQMEMIAQFDYAGTTITDYTGQFWTTDYGNQCAPELGVVTTCPVAFNPAGSGPTWDIPLSGDIIQIPPGGRVQLANGTIYHVTADTVFGLADTGIPFVFTDRSVRNGFRYFYAVTAFDINSVKSGPSSLESPLVTKSVTPRAPAANQQREIISTALIGGDGSVLTVGDYPAIDPANGTFSGPMPPANGATFQFLGAVFEALPVGDVIVRVDSMTSGYPTDLGFGPSPIVYVTLAAGSDTVRASITQNTPSFASHANDYTYMEVFAPLVRYDSTGAREQGIDPTNVRMPVQWRAAISPLAATSGGVALEAGRFGDAGTVSQYISHSRWFDAGGSEPADPTVRPIADSSKHAGDLTGVGRIYSPSSYRQPFEGQASIGGYLPVNTRFRNYAYATAVWYPADIYVTWGAGGTITVRDSTHRTNLPFRRDLAIGYGFVRGSAYAAAGITGAGLNAADACGATCPPAANQSPTRINYRHLYYINPVSGSRGIPTVNLQSSAPTLDSLDFNGDGLFDAMGIVLVINSEPFFMEMNAIPAAGTTWVLRAFGGDGLTATCTPTVDNATDCSGYAWNPVGNERPMYAPGVALRIRIEQRRGLAAGSGDLSRIHTVPDPYYVTNALEITANTKVLRFVNLPDRAIIRIYSASGILVNVINHNSPGGGGEVVWNLRNRNNQFVASGVYFYHVETPDGQERIGRFTVVNFAQ